MLERVAALRLGHVARVVELLHQRRMHDRDVVPLEIVVDVDLPVAADDPALARSGAHGLEAPRRQPLRQVFESLDERRRRRIQVDEKEAEPALEPEFRERLLFLVEVLDAVELRRVDEAPVQGIAPAVVTAAEGLTTSLPRRDRPGPVAADIRERTEAGIRPSNDEERLARDLGREEPAGSRDLVFVADELPRSREDPLALDSGDLRIGIEARRDRRGGSEAILEGEIELAGVHPADYPSREIPASRK